MERYTVGIYFKNNLTEIALILKNRPEWQNNKFNFPGGHIESNERNFDCIVREFFEECNISSKEEDWTHIGVIINSNKYYVDIFTAIYNKSHGELKTMEDQPVYWCNINNLPNNTISNVEWLIHFAKNYIQQGNKDNLSFGLFNYKD